MLSKRLVLGIALSFFSFLHCSRIFVRTPQIPVGQHPHTLQIVKTMDYLLYLPEKYEQELEWPMLLFLHGAGECGSVLDSVKKHGPPKLAEQIPDMPFIIVSPQCPEGKTWVDEIDELDQLIQEIVVNYKVDVKRLYVTGLSMGGFGTWALGIRFPQRFAALAPICGGGDTSKVCVLKDVPVWVFHGAKDQVVPIERSREMVEALERCGGQVKFTVYPEAGHDAWTETYRNPDFYKWLLMQRRREK